MCIKQLQNELIALYAKTLNKASKWYKQDLQDYTSHIIKNKDKCDLQEKYNRLCGYNSKSFESKCKKQIDKMAACFLIKNN